MSNSWYNEAIVEKMGIRFETKEEMKAFADILQSEFESRVGDKVSKYFTQGEMLEFDRTFHQNVEKAKQMIRENCPDTQEICVRVKTEFDREIIAFKDQITGMIGGQES